ncbi:MAG: hypothetical protein IM602_10275 [Cytophagales bacterium]|uniref:hypothetical protein n=1 Tax=Microcystis sp. M135S2 TaxID=2771144 RepID=UPI00258982B5|nr:hypothetical protein [Microcystis sp. M135S2]MCA2774951.1 hypothetical protein [Microcystis sp. M135S2]MCA6426023.1 hypothetical protein [Cytophagales bacterium]MCA6491782.1 hypothetical protein [Chitinophagaceae bacterium]
MESITSTGPEELDSRPSEDYSHVVSIVICPNCGYCNDTIEKAPKNLESILKSEEYKTQFNNNQFTSIANAFLCKALIKEQCFEFEEAAWAVIHAAWCCDDSELYNQSKYCRNRAVDLIFVATLISNLKLTTKSELNIIMIDLLRRAEQFEKAKKLCNAVLNVKAMDVNLNVLLFQDNLINQKDTKKYNIDDAKDYYNRLVKQTTSDESKKHREKTNQLFRNEHNNEKPEYERDYFDAMTDGQMGDYDDFKEHGGNIDDIDD